MSKKITTVKTHKIYPVHENPFAYIPLDVLNLLWFTDGPLKNCKESVVHRKNEISAYGAVPYNFAISLKEPICISCDWDYSHEKSFLYSDYKNLTSIQRGAYINWLQNIDRGDYTYFLKLYMKNVVQCMLELPEKFDAAFNMMVRLYNRYEKYWFRDDCAKMLLLCCISTDDFYCIEKALKIVRETGTPMVFSSIAILNDVVTAKDILNYVTHYHFRGKINRYYIKKEPDFFTETLKEVLKERFYSEYYPITLHKPYKIARPFVYYIKNKLYQKEYPSFWDNDEFDRNIESLLSTTHAKLKANLHPQQKNV